MVKELFEASEMGKGLRINLTQGDVRVVSVPAVDRPAWSTPPHERPCKMGEMRSGVRKRLGTESRDWSQTVCSQFQLLQFSKGCVASGECSSPLFSLKTKDEPL